MKIARMDIAHFRFILFNLKVFDEIVTPFLKCQFMIRRLIWKKVCLLHSRLSMRLKMVKIKTD